MHGTLPQQQHQQEAAVRKPTIIARPRPRWLTIARFKKAGIVIAAAVLAGVATAGVYDYLNATAQGHRSLIRWGFEYPPDCG